ncbi:MAG TPA: glycosyltransferase family 4 protein [Pseudogracilibacillus sp.]|nr:glycosyltransferase family 4 protein [Pseudogracilibacillus sp.]
MKIIQVSAIDLTMNVLLKELNEQTIEKGHELICVCSDGPHVEDMRNNGFDVRTINIDRQISLTSNLKSIKEMYRLFRKEKPDIVHVHTPIAAILGRVAAKLARVPTIIYTAHGFYFHESMSKLTYNFFYWIEKLAAKFLTDYIFTQSQEDGDLAINKKFLPSGRITVISNGVDVTQKFNPRKIANEKKIALKNELGIKETDKVITFIGRLVKEKGIFELLESFEEMKHENVKLLIIGSNEDSERDQTTKSKLEKYYNNKNIIFTGFRSDIPELLALTDVFCLPSYREGMPRSIIEAMSMECAIVATNIRGSREEVDHNINGYLVPLKTIKPLSNALEDAVSNEDKLNEFKVNARKKALELYDENNVVNTQLQIFENVVKGKCHN